MNVELEASWQEMLKDEFSKPYFEQLMEFVKDEYKNHIVFPPSKLIFSAFEHTPFTQTKVVILGQDPYHGIGQAHGLSFSVNDGVDFPPSLYNIFKEMKTDLGKSAPFSGNLNNWASQGVLMLNATLTVRANTPGSHQNKGWEQFTDAVIQKINDQKSNVVFILWGKFAQKKGSFINKNKHYVIESAHPSPLSAYQGFYGSRPFSKTNEFLKSKNIEEIDW